MIYVDDSTLFLDWISVLGSHQEVLDRSASLTMHLYPKLSANVFNALTETTIVWYHYIGLLCVVTGSVYWCLFSAWIVYFLLDSVESPCGVFAIFKCILQMLFFFMQQFCVGGDGICSVLQCSNHTILAVRVW